jgi:hypothetical protein
VPAAPPSCSPGRSGGHGDRRDRRAPRRRAARADRRLNLPCAALALALACTALQALPLVPASWQHPVWKLARRARRRRWRRDLARPRDAGGALSLHLHVAVLWSALHFCRASAQAWLAPAAFAAMALAATLLVGVTSPAAVSLGYALLLGIGCAQPFESRRR